MLYMVKNSELGHNTLKTLHWHFLYLLDVPRGRGITPLD